MIEWITANIANIVVMLIIAAIVTAIIVKMVRDKRQGKSSCGCGCGGCASSESCRSKKK